MAGASAWRGERACPTAVVFFVTLPPPFQGGGQGEGVSRLLQKLWLRPTSVGRGSV